MIQALAAEKVETVEVLEDAQRGREDGALGKFKDKPQPLEFPGSDALLVNSVIR
jgi:hypothetical protein